MYSEKPLLPTVETCPHRKDTRSGASPETATCAILQEVFGGEWIASCTVSRDACEACWRSFPPSAASWNPVVASLVYERGAKAVEAASGKDLEGLRRLCQTALERLDVVYREPLSASASDLDSVRPLVEFVPPPRVRHGATARQWALCRCTADRAIAGVARAGTRDRTRATRGRWPRFSPANWPRPLSPTPPCSSTAGRPILWWPWRSTTSSPGGRATADSLCGFRPPAWCSTSAIPAPFGPAPAPWATGAPADSPGMRGRTNKSRRFDSGGRPGHRVQMDLRVSFNRTAAVGRRRSVRVGLRREEAGVGEEQSEDIAGRATVIRRQRNVDLDGQPARA